MRQFVLELGKDLITSGNVSVARSTDETLVCAVLGDASSTDVANDILRRYQRDRRHVPDPGRADIGFALLDRDAASAMLVAAVIPTSHIYWRFRSGTLTAADGPVDVCRAFGETPTLDLGCIYDYVYFHCIPGPRTIFRGISKLSAGHAVHMSAGEAHCRRYWLPTFAHVAASTFQQARAELHELIDNSVRACAAGSSNFATFLSGGIDSSTVTGYASRIKPELPTISMGFDASGYDEISFARIVSSHFRTRPIEYYVTPDVVLETLPDIAAAFHEPFGNSSAAATYHCARIASQYGIDLLLAGDGGDELFGGNERYAKQLVFQRYQLLPASVRIRLLEPVLRAASGVTGAFPIGKAASYVAQANIPLPDRLQTYNFLNRHDATDVFTAGLLELARPQGAVELLRNEFHAPMDADALDRMLFLDWKFTLQDNDLVKVGTMCRMAGVDVTYPLLGRRLLEFSTRIPPGWKVRNGELRWFFRRAMRGFLPDATLTKSKHGFGLPFGVWTRRHAGLAQMSQDCLQSLGRRGLFRPPFLETALHLHREGHAGYYGELVWILMALELWLQRHAPATCL